MTIWFCGVIKILNDADRLNKMSTKNLEDLATPYTLLILEIVNCRQNFRVFKEPNMAALAFNPSTQDADAGRSL